MELWGQIIGWLPFCHPAGDASQNDYTSPLIWQLHPTSFSFVAMMIHSKKFSCSSFLCMPKTQEEAGFFSNQVSPCIDDVLKSAVQLGIPCILEECSGLFVSWVDRQACWHHQLWWPWRGKSCNTASTGKLIVTLFVCFLLIWAINQPAWFISALASDIQKQAEPRVMKQREIVTIVFKRCLPLTSGFVCRSYKA